MTKAKAKTVIAELIELGYRPMIELDLNGDYKLTVFADDNGVTINALKNFQDTQGITGRVKLVVFN